MNDHSSVVAVSIPSDLRIIWELSRQSTEGFLVELMLSSLYLHDSPYIILITEEWVNLNSDSVFSVCLFCHLWSKAKIELFRSEIRLCYFWELWGCGLWFVVVFTLFVKLNKMKIFKYIKSALGFDSAPAAPPPPPTHSETLVSYDKKEIRAPIPV